MIDPEVLNPLQEMRLIPPFPPAILYSSFTSVFCLPLATNALSIDFLTIISVSFFSQCRKHLAQCVIFSLIFGLMCLFSFRSKALDSFYIISIFNGLRIISDGSGNLCPFCYFVSVFIFFPLIFATGVTGLLG